MTLPELEQFCKTKKADYPALEEKIENIYRGCLDEIQNGEGEVYQINLAIEDIDSVIYDELGLN